MAYQLRFHVLALREWRNLVASIREPFKKKLAERLQEPRVPSAALHGVTNCYKIKLHSLGSRLVYRVDQDEIFVTALAVGRRDKLRVYQQADARSKD